VSERRRRTTCDAGDVRDFTSCEIATREKIAPAILAPQFCSTPLHHMSFVAAAHSLVAAHIFEALYDHRRLFGLLANDEHGVIAADGADDFGPARGIDSRG
jgi:hypothetical protein